MKALTLLLAASLLLLSACQDTQRTFNASPAQGATVAEPESDAETSIQTASFSPVYTAAYRDAIIDTDRDGIPDDEDVNPHEPPQRPLSGPPLAVTALVSPRAGIDLTDWVIAGEPVQLETTGGHHYGGPWWVRWHHADGILARAVVPDVDGRVSLTAPEVMPHSVSLVAGHYVSESRLVQSRMAGAPLLYPITEPLKAGETVRLAGEQLDGIEHLWLVDDELNFSARSDELELLLPLQPTASMLSWQDDRGRLHELLLPLLRPVHFEAAADLDDAAGWRLITEEEVHSLDAPVTLWLPAGQSTSLRWTRNDRPYSALSLVLPSTTDVKVGAENMLATWLWRYRTGQGGSRDVDFSTQLPLWTAQLETVETSLVEALKGNSNAYNIARAVFSELAPGLVASADHSVAQRWGISDYLGDTLDAIFAGGPLYEPIVDVSNLRAKPGSDSYNNIAVGSHRDLSTCGSFGSKPSDLWPSDLCIENDSAVYVSARVVDWRSEEVLLDHITSPLDADIIAGTGMGILNIATVSFPSGNGGALCKMRPCRIEVLTGGFGHETNSDLSYTEKQIADWLLARTVLDRIVLEIIKEVTGLGSESPTLTCFAQQLLQSDPKESTGYLITISDFTQKVAQSSSASEVMGHTFETIVKALLEKLQSMATDPDFAPCLVLMSDEAGNEVLSNIGNRLAQVASSAAVPLRVAQIVATAYDQWEVFTTPRKIVFDVAPRAAITEVTTSSDERRLYADSPTDYLRLYGTHLVDPLDGGYFPDLVLTDRGGKTARMTITPTQVFDASDMSWVDLRIRVEALQPLIDQLSGSRFDVMLEMTHDDFDGFPGGVLPLPAIHFDWVGDARLIGINAGLIRAGDYGVIYGENLESYRRPDLQLMFSDPSLGIFMARDVVFRNARSIAFTLPDTMPSGSYEVHLLVQGLPTLISDSPVEVMADDASYVRILDNGEKQDDRMAISLMSDSDEALSVKGSSSLFLIPTQNSNAFDIWIGWEAGELQNTNGDSRDLNGINVACMDGSEDGVCTLRIVGDVYQSDGTRVRFDVQDTLATGKDVLAQ